MKMNFCVLVLTIVFATTLAAANVIKKEEIRKTLRFKEPIGAGAKVLVDNMSGSIDVVGYDGDEVILVARKTIDAESDRKIQEAIDRVSVDMTEEEDRILIYVNAPWRCSDGSVNYRGRDYYGYDVQF